MATVRNICGDAHIEVGILDPSEAMSAEQGAYALRVLNRMLQKWSTEELMIYTVNRSMYSLVAGTQSYTLGTGGTFNSARPARIQMASVVLNTGGLPIEKPLQILTDEEWQGIAVKASPSTFPTKLWITGDMPLNTLWFWPKPSDSTVQVAIYAWSRVNEFAGLDDVVVLPLGYEEALVTNLAVALSGAFGVSPSPTLSLRAVGAKAAIESLNIDPIYASFDGFGKGGGRSVAIASNGYQVDR